MVGLGLGWWAAGLMEASLRTGGETGRDVVETTAELRREKTDPAREIAREMVPLPQDARALRPAVWIGVGLFAAAVVLGRPVLRKEEPSPDREEGRYSAED